VQHENSVRDYFSLFGCYYLQCNSMMMIVDILWQLQLIITKKRAYLCVFFFFHPTWNQDGQFCIFSFKPPGWDSCLCLFVKSCPTVAACSVNDISNLDPHHSFQKWWAHLRGSHWMEGELWLADIAIIQYIFEPCEIINCLSVCLNVIKLPWCVWSTSFAAAKLVGLYYGISHFNIDRACEDVIWN
jgi:hypothetical protein